MEPSLTAQRPSLSGRRLLLAALVLLGCACSPEPALDRPAEPQWTNLAKERVVVDALVGDGFLLREGEHVERIVSVPRGSALRFRTLANGPTELAPADACSFRITLDGEHFFEHRISSDGGRLHEDEFHSIPLPVGELRFRFEAEADDPALLLAFVEPVIGPARIGTYGQRPRGLDTHPDVVLFVADTFRADNLAVHGGDPEVAPRLNELATRSRCFLQARSPSVWTLPAHASLFTGLFPLQHGAVLREGTLPGELDTLAELFARAGYRTGAITDAAFVSRDYRMDQGFGTFVEFVRKRHSLAQTLAEASAFLDRDDGRPVFLFVHTYRTHEPYRIGPEESTAELDALQARTARMLHGKTGDERRSVLHGIAMQHLALYRRGAQALDEAVGPWFEELGERRLLREGILVFTSDHGEEFLEHGRRRHGGMPHDEKTRIPLLLHGASIEPGEVLPGATLTDLAPTLARFAGVEPLGDWIGRDLLSLTRERPTFSYNGDPQGTGFVSVVRGRHKIFSSGADPGLADGVVDEAYDLALDPGETRDVSEEARASGEDWPAELARSAAPLWAELARPLVQAVPTVELSEEARDDLRRLGYFE